MDVFTPDNVEAQEKRSKARKSTLRRPFFSRRPVKPWRHGAAEVNLGVSFAECDRSKGVWACPIHRLEGSVGFAVRFSMLIDGAARI